MIRTGPHCGLCLLFLLWPAATAHCTEESLQLLFLLSHTSLRIGTLTKRSQDQLSIYVHCALLVTRDSKKTLHVARVSIHEMLGGECLRCRWPQGQVFSWGGTWRRMVYKELVSWPKKFVWVFYTVLWQSLNKLFWPAQYRPLDIAGG